MKKIKGQKRQGDVLIQQVDSIPNGATKIKHTGKITVAHGEATGHHHTIEADKADWWKDADSSDQFVNLVKEKKPKLLTHQEHAPATVAPRKHMVRRQREYSANLIRRVAD